MNESLLRISFKPENLGELGNLEKVKSLITKNWNEDSLKKDGKGNSIINKKNNNIVDEIKKKNNLKNSLDEYVKNILSKMNTP